MSLMYRQIHSPYVTDYHLFTSPQSLECPKFRIDDRIEAAYFKVIRTFTPMGHNLRVGEDRLKRSGEIGCVRFWKHNAEDRGSMFLRNSGVYHLKNVLVRKGTWKTTMTDRLSLSERNKLPILWDGELGFDGQGSVPGKGMYFCIQQHVRNVSLEMEIKQPQHEADTSSPSGAETFKTTPITPGGKEQNWWNLFISLPIAAGRRIC